MKFKRLFISVTLALTMVLGLALPVFADTYLSYYPTTIVDSSGGARTALPVITGINGQSLIDAGLIKATGLDTRMSIGDASVAGNNIPYMVSETQITTYLDSLPGYGQTEARLYTGYSSDVSGFDIITGTDGYITIPSDISDSMQPGSDFEIEQKGYVDTTGGANTNLVYKEDAFRTYIDGATNITSEIHSIPAPLSPYSSASDGRIEATNAVYNTAWVAVTGAASTTLGTLGQRTGFYIDRAYFYFDTSALPDDCVIDSATLKLYGAEDETATDFLITIQNGQPAHPEDPLVNGDYDKSFYSGDGGSLTTDGFSLVAYNDVPLNATGLTWISKTATTKFCVRSSEDIAGSAPTNNEYVRVYTSEEAGVDKDPQLVVNYHVLVEVTATGIDSGELIVKTTAAANVMTLSVTNYTGTHQGDSPQDVDITGVSVPDNDNDWKINQNDVMPKMEYYKHTVSGVEHAWYEPNTIVEAYDYDGTADAGSSDVKIIDAELIQADDYWNDALLTITSAEGAAPEGETAIITDFKDATNELNFAALTAAVEADDTYTVDFGALTDRSYYGLDFAGADYITVVDDPSFNITTNLTAMVWVLVDDITDVKALLLSKHRAIAGGREWTLEKTNVNGKITVNLGDPADGSHETTLSTDNEYLVNNTWALVGFTFDNGTVLIYYNGVSVPFGGVAPPATLYNGAQPVQLGATPILDQFLIGKLDEALIFSETLDSGQMLEAYNAGLGNYTPPTTTGLVMHLHMEEGSDTATVDTSGEGNDGVITNATWVNGKVPRLAGDSGTNDGKLTWGVNSATTITYGKVISSATTASTASEEGGYTVPEADMPAEWYGTASNLANLPLYDMYLGIESETGIPVQTLYVLSIVTVCFAFAIAGFVMFNSVMMSVIGVGVGLGIGSSMTVVPLWIFFTFLILAIGIMYLKGRSGV